MDNSTDIMHDFRQHLKALSWLAMASFLGQLSVTVAGGIIADLSAPVNKQPLVFQTSNGVPQVNINTPSAAGVSRDIYSQFDVNSQGAILNNAHTNVQTQLGGWIQGNPSLAGGTARVILNEVNTSNPSLLNGYIEVAGDKAQVVIANPSGVTCDGCGFINANRVTLTTGKPIINGGSLDGYLVERGIVTVQGAGLDSSQNNYTDIIARSIAVNAGIWANDLNVTAGANRVNTDQTIITSITEIGTVPAVAIDVATLGGMYAGKIHLVGTENGVGVSNAGNIAASVGEFTLTADGTLINTGQINSSIDTTIIINDIVNSGKLYAQGSSTLTTQGNITNSGTIAAQNDTNLNAYGNNSNINSTASSVLGAGINTDGTLRTTGNLTVDATQHIAALGQNLAAGDLSSTAQSQDLTGSQTTGQNISLIASNGNLNATNATVLANDTMTVNVSDTLTNTAATLIANNNLTINSTGLTGNGEVLSHGDLTIQLINDYTHTGIIQADDNATLTSNGIVTNQSELAAGNTLNVTAAAIDNQSTAQISAAITRLTASDSHTLTNRGLIDGSDTFIDAITLNNLGTGRIYGDHIAIVATTLFNNAESSIAPVIAARNKLDIGATIITNSEQALLFSAGDMSIGSSLDADHIAIGQADTLNNTSASIEALGNMQISVATFNNTNAHFSTSAALNSTTNFYQLTMGQWCSTLYNMPGCTGNWLEDFTEHSYTQKVYEPVVTQSDPAKILAGGSLTLYGNNLTNDKSQIIAGGTLSGDLANLNNIAAEGIKTNMLIDQYVVYQKYEGYIAGSTNTISTTATVTLPVTIVQDNTAVNGTGTNITVLGTSTVSNVTANTSLPNNNFFQTKTNPDSHYLIETDPQFANYRTWLSSDFMLSQLSIDPVTTLKRLGDGFYEQKLVREQLAQLTGRRFMEGYSSDESQYQTLMTQAITFANAHQLAPGVALTETQVAQLTSDIVWLIEKSITLADGSMQQVLVPQVYMRLKEGDMHVDGTLIAAEQVQLNLAGDLNNSGSIAGRSIVSITAGNINNLGGHITANNTMLSANKDLNNRGGAISGDDVLSLSAGHNIDIATTTSTADKVTSNSRFTRTTVDRVAGLYVTNPNGILVANAGNDMQLNAANIINAGSNGQTSLAANNNLTLGTVTESELNSVIWDARNYGHLKSSQEIGTSIQTQGNVTLTANNDLSLRAASLNSAEGAIIAKATHNLTIETGQAIRDEDSAHFTQKSGILSSRSKSSHDTLNETLAISSTLSGESISLQAGNDITVSGSNVVATNDTNVTAQNNMTIEATQQTHDETHLYKKSKSGVFGSGGVGFTIGSQELATTNDQHQVSNVASTVGSLEGNVNLEAGKAYQQTGSDVLALQGNIDINAQKVDIEAATNLFTNERTTKFKQSGLTVAITNPVISAVQTGLHMTKAAEKTSNNRMKLLAAGSIALSTNNAIDAVKASQSSIIGGKENQIASTDINGKPSSRNANAADKVGGINVSISLGSSKNSSKSNQTITTAQSSKVVAGSDITINATGAGNNSDLNIIGSQIKAGGNLTLKAQNQLNLVAAANTNTLKSKNTSSSASVGVSYGSDGLLLNLVGSKGEGRENGEDITWTETTVQSGSTVQLESGSDTTLKGATMSGQQVIAEIGNNLTIQSLQDTSTYTSKQQDVGGSFSIGYGKVGGSFNYSKSAIDSDYASVLEQSGIKAGDDGFQVNVNGNTDLRAALVASNQIAIDNNKNSLTTQTLTSSSIQNKSEYEAESNSMGLSVDYNQSQSVTKNMGNNLVSLPAALTPDLTQSGSKASVTHSAISTAQTIITDDAKQNALTGKNATTTIATLNRDTENTNNDVLAKPDVSSIKQEIEANATIMSTATQQVTTAINGYYAKRMAKYDQQYNDTINQARDKEAQAANQEANGNKTGATILKADAQSLRYQAIDIRNERDAPRLSQGLALTLGNTLVGGLGGQVNVANTATTYAVGTLGNAFLLTAQKRGSDITQGFAATCKGLPTECTQKASQLGNTVNNAELSLDERIRALMDLKDDNGNVLYEIKAVDSNRAGDFNIVSNGILNEPDRALVLGIGHLPTNDEKQTIYLSYNDTQGGIADLLNAAIDTLAQASSNTSDAIVQALIVSHGNTEGNGETNLLAHSGGTLASNIALNDYAAQGNANPKLHINYFGSASSTGAAVAAALNAAGLAGAAPEQQANWLAYGNIEGLTDSETNGLSYNNHEDDPVATFIGGNSGQTNIYNDPNSTTHLQGVEVGNILRSAIELKALFTTSDSAHSTYRWNDPSTWPTTTVEPITNNQ
jgi:filamentous hemagglutinin